MPASDRRGNIRAMVLADFVLTGSDILIGLAIVALLVLIFSRFRPF